MDFFVMKCENGLFGTKWGYAERVEPLYQGETLRCPVCNAYVQGTDWLPPHTIKISSAKPEKWGDFLWGTIFPFMVNERFIKAYQDDGLTGIDTFYPKAKIARVGRKKTGDIPENIPSYYLVDVPWGKANMDDTKSRAVRKGDICEYCHGFIHKFEGLYIEDGSWHGDDIFRPRGYSGRCVVTEKFKNSVESRNMKNVQFIPAKLIDYEEYRPGFWYVRED